MAKEKRTRHPIELTEEQKKEIAELKKEVAKIRNKGRFMGFYQRARKLTIDLQNDKTITENEKKSKLLDGLNEICSDLEQSIA